MWQLSNHQVGVLLLIDILLEANLKYTQCKKYILKMWNAIINYSELQCSLCFDILWLG